MPDKREQEFENLMSRLSGHMTPEQQAQVRQAFSQSPAALHLLGEEVLAKQDYHRLIQQTQAESQSLAREKAELAELATKVQEYETYLNSQALPRDQYEQLKQERDLLASKVAQLSTQYPALAEDLTLEPSSTPNGGNQIMPNQQNGGRQESVAPPQNPIQPVNQLKYQQDQQNMAALAMLTPAAVNDLAVKHQQLFGTPLGNMTELIQEATSTGRSMEELWAEKYKVADRLQALDAERVENEVQARVKAELAKQLSAAALNGSPGINPGADQIRSPFLNTLQPPVEGRPAFSPDATRIANQGTGQGEAARRATEAFISGKYKNERFDLLTS